MTHDRSSELELLQSYLGHLAQLEQLLEQQTEALLEGNTGELGQVVAALDRHLAEVEKAAEGLTALAGEGEDTDPDVQSALADLSRSLEATLSSLSANEALISRALLVNRYCLNLIAEPDQRYSYTPGQVSPLETTGRRYGLLNRRA